MPPRPTPETANDRRLDDSAFASGAEDGSDAARSGMWVFLASEAMLFGAVFLVYALARIDHAEAFAAASSRLSLAARDRQHGDPADLVPRCAGARGDAAPAPAGARSAGRRGGAAGARLSWASRAGNGRPSSGEGLFPVGRAFHRLPRPRPRGRGAVLPGLFRRHRPARAAHDRRAVAFGWLLATWRGRDALPERHAVGIFGLYWHFVDVVWIFLFPLLYLVDRT